MPNRILKESICTSDNLNTLTAFQEIVFYRLIVNCDDYGRMDARPKLLASVLFPLKEVRAAQIEDALRKLTSAELVTLYYVDGKPFLQMNTWNKHQRVRDSKEKYPGPEKADSPQAAASCGELPRVAARARAESESESESKTNPNPNPNPNPNAGARADDGFDAFWATYPRHTGKQDAQRAWRKLAPDADLQARMLEAVARQKQSAQWTKDGGQFIPHPATWINGRRWEDELPKGGKTVTAQQFPQRDYNEAALEDQVFRDFMAMAKGGAKDG